METINRVLQIREGKLILYYVAGVAGWLLFSNELINLIFTDTYLLLTLKNINTWILGMASFGVLVMVVHGMWNTLREKEQQIEHLLEERELVVELDKSELHDTLMRIFRKAPSPMAILTGDKHSYDFVNEAPGDSGTVYRDVVYNPMTDGAGEVYGIFVQCNDITERVKAQKRLEAELEIRKRFVHKYQDRTPA